MLEYVEQLRLKQAILRESLVRAGVAWEREVPVAPSPETGWRTRATFHLAWVGDELRLGLHEEARHRVVDLRRCPQVSDAMNRVLGELRPRLRASWQVSKRIASVVLAESGDGGRLVACVDGDLATADLPALVALGEVPGLSGFGALAGPQEARRFAGLRGEPYVEATVGGLRLRAHALSFFQSNRFLLEPLVRCVAELVPAGGRLLDLYAGAGLFALSLAPGRDEVLGIEGNGQSVEDARANAEAAGMRHVRFEAVEVREALLARPPAPDERVVLDPPRTGAGTDVARAVCARRPEAVVYVSCDPPTLGRDLKAFLAGGYRIEAVRAFDMFPDTFHLETVVKLLPA